MASAYKSYEVGYFGDHAGVRCELTEPVYGTSSKPKDLYHRETFPVVTTHHSFNVASLATAIQTAEATKDYATCDTLQNAQSSLQDFIAANGVTNPAEAVDWADDAQVLVTSGVVRVPVPA